MQKIESQYKEYAVKIVGPDTEGSGCLYQPLTGDYTYVFTAKHCISKEEKLYDKSKIILTRSEPKNDILTIQDIFLHSELDIAIISINKVHGLHPLQIYFPEKDEVVSIYGYPQKLSKSEEEREKITCNIDFRRDSYFELSPNSLQFTFNSSVPDNIVGFSGAGVFLEINGSLKIVGVFTRLKGPDGIYNKFCAYKFTVFQQFISKLGLGPLDGEDDTRHIMRDGDFLKKVFYLPYDVASEPYYLKREADNIFLNYFLSPKNIWISGISGVGKTDLVFRNMLTNNRKFIFIDLSGLENRSVEEHFAYINDEIVEQCSIKNKSTRESILERIPINLGGAQNDGGQILLFIDEVPISNSEKFYLFLTHFVTISERFINTTRSREIKWIICTRINPIHHLKNDDSCLPNFHKASKNFHFKNLDTWSRIDMSKLLYVLKSSLNFSVSEKTEESLISFCGGLPGKLKNIIQTVIMENCSIDDAIRLF
jgi:hypothetical protein